MRKNLLLVALVSLVSLGVFWMPFLRKTQQFWGINFGKAGMETVVQNFDGLNFLVVAKSWYNPEKIEQINAQFLTGNDPIYFAAHFPLFPGLIKVVSHVVPLPQALLMSIVLSNILLALALYWFFATVLKNQNLAILLTIIALFFPARMLSVRSVGSNEPLFILFILASLTLAIKEKYWVSAVAGALAVLTRSPGILLFVAYTWCYWRKPKILLPYLLMPAALLGLFVFYGLQYQDPLAYFHSGDNLHLFFPPFQIFSNMATWINDMWREDIIYLYLFYGIGLSLLKDKTLKTFGLIYGATLLLIAHRDLGRYGLPIAPLALLGYAPLLSKIPTKVWSIVAILLIPIFLLGWQFVLGNIQPISDWGAFL
ncbi:MAG: hypothetical protein UX62_C0009G0003 [Microgenomates group bacterium GW2011_GWA2_46_7]|nr:MAG: hypothetical protein UX64_C0022G0004 [Microgenomates group bacterium GW2011_GWC2_46_7]KKU46737.1 MAG: hypothetical protein UX62_C0009G0003 [Microgenomates group bacterium GW2011_GWA2_46_7]